MDTDYILLRKNEILMNKLYHGGTFNQVGKRYEDIGSEYLIGKHTGLSRCIKKNDQGKYYFDDKLGCILYKEQEQEQEQIQNKHKYILDFKYISDEPINFNLNQQNTQQFIQQPQQAPKVLGHPPGPPQPPQPPGPPKPPGPPEPPLKPPQPKKSSNINQEEQGNQGQPFSITEEDIENAKIKKKQQLDEKNKILDIISNRLGSKYHENEYGVRIYPNNVDDIYYILTKLKTSDYKSIENKIDPSFKIYDLYLKTDKKLKQKDRVDQAIKQYELENKSPEIKSEVVVATEKLDEKRKQDIEKIISELDTTQFPTVEERQKEAIRLYELQTKGTGYHMDGYMFLPYKGGYLVYNNYNKYMHY